MKGLKRNIPSYLLMILAVICLCIGEWGLKDQKPLVEYAAPYTAPQKSEGKDGEPLPVMAALAQIRESLPDAALSAFILKRGVNVRTDSERDAVCSVYGVAEGWFDLYHRPLTGGRLFGEEEIQNGERVAVVNSSLAYALWGDEEAVDSTLVLNREKFRVVGVVRHPKPAGQTDANELYIPLPAAILTGGDIQQLSGRGVRQSVFESVSVLSGGTVYHLEKERMRAGLPLRYLCVLFLLMFLSRSFSSVKRFTRRCTDQWKQRNAQFYGGRMLFWSLLLGLQWLAAYGLWVAAAYITLRLAVAPAYVLSEWIPEDPSRLRSYGKVLTGMLSQQMALQKTMTESVLTIRYYGGFISAGSILMLLSIGVKKYHIHQNAGRQEDEEEDRTEISRPQDGLYAVNQKA